jgi:glycosyltransferase involved in cell wall biosynthesis
MTVGGELQRRQFSFFNPVRYSLPVKLSVVLITYNEEENIGRTLESVQPLVRDGKGEIVVVDSESDDQTVAIAQSHKAKVFVEKWKGYAVQKNSAIAKATGDWILSLDADEALDKDLQETLLGLLEALGFYEKLRADGSASPIMLQDARAEIQKYVRDKAEEGFAGVFLPRKNFFMGRWIRHAGYWPDTKLRLFKKGAGAFEDRAVHEDVCVQGATVHIKSGALLHSSYPTLSVYIEHMDRYSSLGAQMAVEKGRSGFSFANIVLRPILTFKYNYFLRLGFLDGHEGLLLNLYHAVYVSWKYAKVWELTRKRKA